MPARQSAPVAAPPPSPTPTADLVSPSPATAIRKPGATRQGEQTPEPQSAPQPQRHPARSAKPRGTNPGPAPVPVPTAPVAPPVPPDAWARAWSMPGNDLACLLAALWLYRHRGTEASGAPILVLDDLNMESRERLFAQVKARRLNLGRFRAWPRDQAISTEHLAKIADLDEASGTIRLKGMALELVKLLRV